MASSFLYLRDSGLNDILDGICILFFWVYFGVRTCELFLVLHLLFSWVSLC